MYFNNEKENTNIDHQFKNNKKFNFDLKKYKLPLIIGGGIILLIILIIILVSIFGNKNKYVIELNGDDIMNIYQGTEYIEPGYSSYDKNSNDVTSKVVINGKVDSSEIGEYKISYTIDDVTRVRYVNVVKRPDSIINFRLMGGDKDGTVTINIGGKYEEPGYVVNDSVDGDLSKKVRVSGNVNTSKAGTYTLTYTVVNSANVTMTKTRKVIVK